MVEQIIQQPKLVKGKSQEGQFKINIEELVAKHAECIICFDTFRDPYTTPCGHSYCKLCIEEVINRQHQCPLCNSKSEIKDLVKNFAIGELLAGIEQEVKKEKEKFFEKLANQPGIADHQMQNLGPIQTVFSLNMKESLLTFQAHLDKLQAEKRDLSHKVKSEMNVKIMEAMKDGKDADLKQRLDRQLKEIDVKFDRSVDVLVQSYDEFMKKTAPAPAFLPIRLSIILQDRNQMKLENIQVQPFDNVDDLFAQLERLFVQRGDAVCEWNKEALEVWIQGPLAGIEEQKPEAEGNPEDAQEKQLSWGWREPKSDANDKPLTQKVHVKDLKTPLEAYKLAQGSSVIIRGGPIIFESDKPKECMTLNYSKEAKAAYRYFRCDTCKINWVCEDCKEQCHEAQGHYVLLHIESHVPEYACCYCVKKNKCQITNIKNAKPKRGN